MPAAIRQLVSDPDVFKMLSHKLGCSNIDCGDVFSFENNSLSFLSPTDLPVAVITCNIVEKSKESYGVDSTDKKASDGIVFIKQLTPNICGSIALLHALFNAESALKTSGDSFYANNLNKFKTMTPSEIGNFFNDSEEFKNMHREASSETGTEIEDSECHFVAYIPYQNSIYMMDGRLAGPVKICDSSTPKSFFNDTLEYISKKVISSCSQISALYLTASNNE